VTATGLTSLWAK